MPRGDKSKYKQECKADHIAGSYESLESRETRRAATQATARQPFP